MGWCRYDRKEVCPSFDSDARGGSLMSEKPSDLLPEGLEDRLPQSAAAAARIENAAMGVLAAHGYDRVRPPLI